MQLFAAVLFTATAATYYKGQTIKGKTTEGTEISFTVIDPDAKTCAISSQCIAENTTGKVTVPSYVEGFRVVEAKNDAFYNRKSITSVELPYTVTKLNQWTFQYCESLTEVSLPSNLEEMGPYTFYGCKQLKSVSLPSKITDIPRMTFYNCWSLTSVKFPNAVDSIFDSAFEYCKSLESVALPTTVKYIDNYVFYGCTSLKTITGIANIEYIGTSAFYNTPWLSNLPSGMTYIGKVAFKYVGTIPDNTTINIKEGTTSIAGSAFSGKGLVGIIIPASVKSIGSSPFGSHPGLNSITVATGNKYYDSRGGCNAVIQTTTNEMVAGCNTTIIPSTVKSLAYDAFYGSSITSMNIPDGVDSIANDAFYACSSLKSLTIGKGVRKIGHAFSYCTNLKDIVVSSANPYFDSRNNCKGIVEKSTNTLVVACMATVIPSTVKAIGNYAYGPCRYSNLYTFSIPNQIEKIGDDAFEYISAMRSVTIGRGVKEIGNYAFRGCNNLKVIHALMDTPCEINENVFWKSVSGEADSIYNHATLYVPVGSRLNYKSTAGWSKFKNIVETDGNTQVDGDVFTVATVEGHQLTYQVTSSAKKTCELIGSPLDITGTVTIPASANGFKVLSIGYDAFYASGNERNLTSVSLPEGLVSIGEYALAYNRSLVISQLPSTLESIGAWAFMYLNNTSMTIPAKVESIGRAAFCGCNTLTSLTVDAANRVFTSPAGSNAIIRKDNKTLVVGCKTTVIPEDVECIGEYAFNSITELKEIVIPASVSIIETMAFNNTGLTSITIPATVRSLGKETFRWCSDLVTVYSRNTTPFAIDDLTFHHPSPKTGDTYQIATLYVPRGTKALYQSTDGWKLFENIEESDFNMEMATINDVDYLIDGTARTATVKLVHASDDVVIPATVTYDGKDYPVTAIADYVFCDKSESVIGSVTFPSSISSVAQKAFWRYNPSAIIWNSAAKIPENSFYEWGYTNGNFLLYVNNASVAPSGVTNLIVNGQAGNVVLSDEVSFNCPQEFTASRISLTHNYTLKTGIGTSAGWETLSLPFDVKTITHESKGQLVPFAAYQEGGNSMPFWLYSLSSNGFVKASSIKANTPYIISMPNNENYTSRYNLAGKVTFAASDAKVYRTADAYLNKPSHNGATFIPCYSAYLNVANIYALNVPSDLFPYTGTDPLGSIFVKGGDIVIFPFGARMEKTSSARSLDIVFADNDLTGIQELFMKDAGNEQVKVYNMSGQVVGVYSRSALSDPNTVLPAGVYVINGKKVMVK